jgi:hypothetical protein
VAVPADLVGANAQAVGERLTSLGFRSIKYIAADGSEVAASALWKVVSVDGAGSDVDRDSTITVRVAKIEQPKATPKPQTPTAKPAPAPAPPKAAYYANCAAAKAAGAAPLHRGQPGYRAALDRDNDGVACE